ncbi:MAG: diguanylate cyclase [Sandaracinaceae bacterium]
MTETSIPPEDRGPSRVLIVDDDDARRRMFAIILSKDGYAVDELPHGKELLDTARKNRPDLILLDIMLPGKTGIELTGMVRVDPDLKTTPIILVTAALDDEDSIVRGLACGADDYVVTPVSHGELKARIRVQLRNRRDRELLSWAFEQRKQYKEESRRDALTGIANRRAGEDALEATLAEGQPVSFGMMDIDHFKSVNDTYGHPAGDKVLVQVAGALEGTVRPTDVVARFGGEEFALIAPGMPAHVAPQLGERLRGKVERLTFPADTGVPGVTISIGFATWDGKGTPPAPAALIAMADKALYDAKRGGRNRVVARVF